MNDSTAEIYGITDPDQADLLDYAATEADRIYPPADPDDEINERINVIAGAAKVITGDSDLTALAIAHQNAHLAARAAMDELRGAVIIAAQTGMSESEIARTACLNRMTVRAILGK